MKLLSHEKYPKSSRRYLFNNSHKWLICCTSQLFKPLNKTIMESKKLFDEFTPVSSKEWKQKIQFELKGADYNETLLWESLEGIKVKPFYHKDDFENKISLNNDL